MAILTQGFRVQPTARVGALSGIQMPRLDVPDVVGAQARGTQLGMAEGASAGGALSELAHALSPEGQQEKALKGALAQMQLDAAKEAISPEGKARRLAIAKSNEQTTMLHNQIAAAELAMKLDPKNVAKREALDAAKQKSEDLQNQIKQMELSNLGRANQPVGALAPSAMEPVDQVIPETGVPINAPVIKVSTTRNPLTGIEGPTSEGAAAIDEAQAAAVPNKLKAQLAELSKPVMEWNDKGSKQVETDDSKNRRESERKMLDALKMKGINTDGMTWDQAYAHLNKIANKESMAPDMSTLTDAELKRAQAIANYMQPYPKAMELRNPRTSVIAAAVQMINPAYDAVQYDTKKKIRASYTSGSAKNNLDALNTAIGHLDGLEKSSRALDNSKLKKYNSIANYLISETGDPRVNNFKADAVAVAGELAKVFKGGSSPALAEVDHWLNLFNSSSSPDQLKGTIEEMVKLMQSRAQQLRNSYEEGLGAPADFNFLNSHARKTLERLGHDPNEWDPIAEKTEAPKEEKGTVPGTKVAPAGAKPWLEYDDAKANKMRVLARDNPDDPNTPAILERLRERDSQLKAPTTGRKM